MAATFVCRSAVGLRRNLPGREVHKWFRWDKRYLCTKQSDVSDLSGESTTELQKEKSQEWKILAATCLQRFPTLSREKIDLERKFEDFQDIVRLERSRLCDYELEEIEEEKNRMELEKKALEEELSDSAMLKSDRSDAFEDMKEAREAELQQFTPASRVTEADVKEYKWSLNRKLDHMLYLVVKENGQWMMPAREWSGEKSLIETAFKALNDITESSKVVYYSNSPCSHYKRLSLESKDFVKGEKVFFFKAVLKAANVSTQEQSSFKTGNCLWLSKDELEQLLPKEYFDSISSVLSQ